MGGQAAKIAPPLPKTVAIIRAKFVRFRAEYFNASLNRYAGKANDNQRLILELLEVM